MKLKGIKMHLTLQINNNPHTNKSTFGRKNCHPNPKPYYKTPRTIKKIKIKDGLVYFTYIYHGYSAEC